MYSAMAIANYFIDLAKQHNTTLTPMKLQKLVYFAHGWHLGLFKKPLLNEPVEAWKFGPVISSLYHEFKSYGNEPITKKAQVLDGTSKDGWVWNEPNISNDDTELKMFLNKVWEIYGGFDAIQLSNMTHESGTPWKEIWNEDIRPGTDISDDLIRKYFESFS